MIFVMRHWDGFEFQVMPDGIFLVWEDVMCLFGDSFPFPICCGKRSYGAPS